MKKLSPCCAVALLCACSISASVTDKHDAAGPSLQLSCADACSKVVQLCQGQQGYTDTWAQACTTSCEIDQKLAFEKAKELTDCIAAATTCEQANSCVEGEPAGDGGVDASSDMTGPDTFTPDTVAPDTFTPDTTPPDTLKPDTTGTSPVKDYGLPCQSPGDCVDNHCYVPGTGNNPICSKQCTSNNDCPSGSLCVAMGGTGKHCFVECTSDAFCLAINSDPSNPLQCLGPLPEGWICVQKSEP
jgi:hypothetical protein